MSEDRHYTEESTWVKIDPAQYAVRVRYERKGGHVHCRLFTAPHAQHTFGKAGDLVFNEVEWPIIKDRMVAAGFEVLHEGNGRPAPVPLRPLPSAGAWPFPPKVKP